MCHVYHVPLEWFYSFLALQDILFKMEGAAFRKAWVNQSKSHNTQPSSPVLSFSQLRTQHPDLSTALNLNKTPVSIVLFCVLVMCANRQDDSLFCVTPRRKA